MMSIVVDPSLFCISKKDSSSDYDKDDFLEHLLNNLKMLSDEITPDVYHIDEFIYSIMDLQKNISFTKYFNGCTINKYISLILQKTKKIKNNLNLDKMKLDPCKSEPVMTCNDLEALKYFHILMHYLIIKKEDVWITLGLENKRKLTKNNMNFEFKCNCHTYRLKPEILRNVKDFYKDIKYFNEFWPKKSTNCKESLETLLSIHNEYCMGKEIINEEYSFSDDFIKDLLGVTNDKEREKIIESMILRLSLTAAAAGADNHLRDEEVKNEKNSKTYRFRVKNETRIHYKFVNKAICFINYFGPGKHDKGLKK